MVKPYLWIVIVSGLVAFFLGGGIGANDLANAFGTTYGAKVLTMRQIVMVATVCEFGGAVSLGASVTSTLASGIANPVMFNDDPYVLMYGMLCAMVAALVWMWVATQLQLPVSSTHSIAGGIMGFALVYGGGGGVIWSKHSDEFPFVKGFVPIVASWVISPVLTGAVSSTIFVLLRTLILRPANSVNRATLALPIVVAVTFFLEAFFILFKGAESHLHWGGGRAAWVGACIGAAAGLLTIPLVPLLRRRVRRMTEKAERAAQQEAAAVELEGGVALGVPTSPRSAQAGEPLAENAVGGAGAPKAEVPYGTSTESEVTGEESAPAATTEKSVGSRLMNALGLRKESHSGDGHSKSELPEVELFDYRVEYVFRYLQVFTAICMSFAHGASDVSNSIGPFATIYSIYQQEAVLSAVDVPIWILCLGGAGIVVGLATYGLRMMKVMGEKITRITPSRGFSAELATALVVSFASGYGIPVSSTHSITGAIFALGIVDMGLFKANWLLMVKMCCGWVFTLFVTGFMSAAVFAYGVYTPAM